ncbi:MAG: hypothetical protein HY897_05140 [Deltaproteobacteria bacterium]|nr:hypothetical protein [Deltaproteobacteria bacterium]
MKSVSRIFVALSTVVVANAVPTVALGDGISPTDLSTEYEACAFRDENDTSELGGDEGRCRKGSCEESNGISFCLWCDVPGSGCDCSSLGTPTVKELGAFLLAGSFSLLFFLRRRKRGR